jgi:hypothetical protein
VSGSALLTAASGVSAEEFRLGPGGTLQGDGPLTVTRKLVWTGGTMQGAGTTTVTGTVEISGTAEKTLGQRRLTVENAATIPQVTWSGGNLTMKNGAVFHSAADLICRAPSPSWMAAAPCPSSKTNTSSKSPSGM